MPLAMERCWWFISRRGIAFVIVVKVVLASSAKMVALAGRQADTKTEPSSGGDVHSAGQCKQRSPCY